MKAIFILTGALLLFASCAQKESEEETNTPGSTTASCVATMHDTAFTADYFSNSYPGPLLQLYAYETSSNRSITLNLENKNVGLHDMTTVLNGTNGSCQAGGGIGYYSIQGLGHGAINVTASTSNSITGTFTFTGYTAGGDSAVVSGTFSNMAF